MAHRLRMDTALPEDVNSDSSTHVGYLKATWNSSGRESDIRHLCFLCGSCIHMHSAGSHKIHITENKTKRIRICIAIVWLLNAPQRSIG